jgi:hypothetical protein
VNSQKALPPDKQALGLKGLVVAWARVATGQTLDQAAQPF